VFPQNNHQAWIRDVDIPDMLRVGATICVTGMENAHQRLRSAIRLVRSELNYSGAVSFRAYLSPPGSGFDIHFDARVTTTLQISGKKRWWYSAQPAVAFPMHNSSRGQFGAPREPRPEPGALSSVVLRPGDVLCLPAGVWHRAEGEGKEMSLALNMAFEHQGGSVFDSIVMALEERLVQDPRWRAPLPTAPGRKRHRVPEEVARVLRDRIDALRSELSILRDDDAQLARAWRIALGSGKNS
jgi:ribosomal protein L16 Arg81 hydroxylase